MKSGPESKELHPTRDGFLDQNDTVMEYNRCLGTHYMLLSYKRAARRTLRT